MPINYNALSPIEAPKMLGALPSQGNSNPAANIGAALSNIGKDMREGESHNLEMKLGAQKLESNDMQLKEQRQSFADGQALRNAAKQSENDYVKALMTTNPPAAMDYLSKKKLMEKTVAETLGEKSKTIAQNLRNSDPIVMQIGDLVHTADTLTKPNGQPMTPEEKTQFISKGAEIIGPQATAVLKNVAPNGYDQNTAIAFNIMGQQAQARALDEGMKNAKPSDTAKRITETNAYRTQAGQAPLSPQEQADISGAALKSSIAPRNPNPTDTAIAQGDTVKLKEVQARAGSYQETQGAIDKARIALDKTPNILLGPIQGFLGIAKLNPDAQVVISNMNKMTLAEKNRQNMGSQGFTDKDRQYVEGINGNVSNFKGSLKELLDQTESFMTHAKQQDWLTEYNIRKTGSDQAEQWLQDNPEPMVKVQLPNGKVGSVPVRQRDALIKETKAKVI